MRWMSWHAWLPCVLVQLQPVPWQQKILFWQSCTEISIHAFKLSIKKLNVLKGNVEKMNKLGWALKVEFSLPFTHKNSTYIHFELQDWGGRFNLRSKKIQISVVGRQKNYRGVEWVGKTDIHLGNDALKKSHSFGLRLKPRFFNAHSRAEKPQRMSLRWKKWVYPGQSCTKKALRVSLRSKSALSLKQSCTEK